MTVSASELIRLEQIAAAQNLLLPTENVSWGELLAHAQSSLAKTVRSSMSIDDDKLANSEDSEAIATARILDACAIAATDVEQKFATAILASMSFALQGNFSSASAAVRIARSLRDPQSDAEWIAIAVSAPRLIGEALDGVDPEGYGRGFLESLNSYLIDASLVSESELRDQLLTILHLPHEPFNYLLIGQAHAVISSLAHHSASQVLAPYVNLLSIKLLESLNLAGIRVLLPTQVKAIEEGLLNSRENALVSLPTSTGKTLLGELSIFSSLSGDRPIGIFVVPYVALATQTYKALMAHVPANIRVIALSGGLAQKTIFEDSEDATIVVATPERFDQFLRSSGSLIRDRLRCVVIDEAHNVANSGRGVRIEGMISRLRLLQASGHSFRIVCLSAVIGNLDQVASWLGPATVIHRSRWRPTAKRMFVWSTDGQLKWHLGDDQLTRDGQLPHTIIASRRLPWPEPGVSPNESYPALQRLQPKAYRNVAYLLEYLIGDGKSPVLCICSSKAATRSIALALADRLEEVEVPSVLVDTLIDKLRLRFPHLSTLTRALQRRVAYHNASLPVEIRTDIEELAIQNQLRAVIATNTLAEGIDLPFRATVLADWLTWKGKKQVPMDPLLFKNITGRCGRAGFHTQGDVYIFDNPLGPLQYTSQQVRPSIQLDTFFPSLLPSLRSELEVERLESDARAVLAAQFLAAVPENPREEDLADRFTSYLFAASRPGSIDFLKSEIASIRDEILDGPRPLAIASSPMKLTDLGSRAVATGLSPNTVHSLSQILETSIHPVRSGEFVRDLLALTVNFPEMTSDRVRTGVMNSRSRFPIKLTDVAQVTDDWIHGLDLVSIFLRLPYIRRSKYSRLALQWSIGAETGSYWNDSFDKFVEFVDAVFVTYLPWILRASEHLTQRDTSVDLFDYEGFASELEIGVSSAWAVRLIGAVPDIPRRVAIISNPLHLAGYIGAETQILEDGSIDLPSEQIVVSLRSLLTLNDLVLQDETIAVVANAVRGHWPEVAPTLGIGF